MVLANRNTPYTYKLGVSPEKMTIIVKLGERVHG